ncbi:MAG: sigma-70 family RNA polymerase sigma factor [Planctomycetota bacterium]
MSELNDLLRRYLEQGDAAAMEEIVQRTRPRLLAAARRIGNPQDAEDSVQATYHALLRRGDRPLDAPLIAWLLTVVVRIAFRRKAIEQREGQLAEQLALPSDEPGPRRAAEILERNRNLRAEVGRLPAHYRDALILRYLEGLSVRECARLLEVPEETARTRLKRARRLLRGRLHPRVAGLVMFVPWWFADTARASSLTLSGVAMKSKVALVAVILAVAGLLFVSRDLFRSEGAHEVQRIERESVDRTAAETRDESSAHQSPERSREEPLPDPVDLEAVDRDRDVHGVVVRADSSPVAGAVLRLVDYPWRRGSVLHYDALDVESPGPSTRSARDGTFRIPWQRGRMGWLQVSARGMADRRMPWVQAGERVRIQLDAGSEVAVRVRDAAGNPVPEAKVRLFRNPSRNPGHSREHRGETDAQGECLLQGVNGPSNAYVAVNHVALGSAGWLSTEVPGNGKRVEVEITYAEPRTITGRVTDKQTGEPVAGALVGMNWVQNNAVRSGEDGSYTLPGWNGKGVTAIHCSHPDYGRTHEIVGAREEIDFELNGGDRLTGRLVDPAGEPVADARIAAIGSVHDGRRQWTSRAYAQSGADGTFAMTGLSHEMFHSVVILRDGFGRVLYDIEPAPQRGGTIDMGDITLRPGLSIEGRATDGAGKALARVPVTLLGANADRNRYQPKMGNRNMKYGEEEERVTDDLGRFRFPDLAPGNYQLVANRGGGSRAQRKVVLADADVRDVVVSFEATRPLTVRVKDPEGNPVSDAFISGTSGVKSLQGRTDGTGEATLQAPGPVTQLRVVFVSSLAKDTAYLMPEPVRNLPEDQEVVEFTLKRAATITGVVLKPDGKPLPRALVGAEGMSPAYADEEGRFKLLVEPGARVDLVFRGSSNQRGVVEQKYEGELRGVSAGARDQKLQLRDIEGGKSLTVLVLDPDGKPMAGERVWALAGSNREGEGVTSDDGRVTLTNLLKRRMSVMVMGKRDRPADVVQPRAASVVPDGQEITLQFRRAVARSGVVTGAKAAHVMLYRDVKGELQYVAHGRANDEGRFTLMVPIDEGDGPFTILANAQGEDGPLVARKENVRFDGSGVEIALQKIN